MIIQSGIVILVLFYSLLLYSAEPIYINKNIEVLKIGKHLEIFEDRKGKLIISDLVNNKGKYKFKDSLTDSPGYGFTKSVYWVRFKVKNNLKKKFNWYLEITYPLIDEIELYTLTLNNDIIHKKLAGNKYIFSKRDFNYRSYVFKMSERIKKGHIYYIKVKTKTSMNLHMKMYPKKGFVDSIFKEHFALGIYYGAILIMLIFNFFLFCSVKDKAYLYYVLYYLSFVFTQLILNGLSYQYLWPNSPWLAGNTFQISMILSIIFSIQFVRIFIDTKKYTPEIDSIFRVVILICLILLPFSSLIEYSFFIKTGISLILFMAILITFSAVKIALKGYRPARFYLLAWSFFWIGTIIFILKSYSILPDTIITRWGQQVASLFEVTLISFALADRINTVKKEFEYLSKSLEALIEMRTNELNNALDTMKVKEQEINLELDLAADIQKGILPQLPYHFEGIKIEGYYKAMGKVSGDFYDIFKMQGGYLGIIIADASGHGIPAAFITAMAKISFSDAVQNYFFPSDIFKHVNNELLRTVKTDDFVTGFFIVISPTFEVFYGNASHQMAMVLRNADNSLEEWDTNGLFMGALQNADTMYEYSRSHLNFGDRLLLYTDGVTDAVNSKGDIFGEARLKETFEKSAHLPLEDVRDKIVSEVDMYRDGSAQTDDIALLIIEIDFSYEELVDSREKGFSFLAKGMIPEALIELRKCLSIDKKDEKANLYIGECYLKNKEYEHAIEHLNIYLVNNEIDGNVWFHLAQAYFNLTNYEKANEAAQKSAQFRINSIEVLIISGLSLRSMGKDKEALKVWKNILAIEPDNELAKLSIEEILNNNKNEKT